MIPKLPSKRAKLGKRIAAIEKARKFKELKRKKIGLLNRRSES